MKWFVLLMMACVSQSGLAKTLLKSSESIEVKDAVIRHMPPSAMTTAGFMEISNKSGTIVKLIKVVSNKAKKNEIHTHETVNGMMQMKKLDFVEIAANSSLVFKPGHLHIMLIDLNAATKKDEKVDVDLYFADGSKKTVSFNIQ